MKTRKIVTIVFQDTRRPAPHVTTHRIDWEDNKQTTETMDPSSETMKLRGNKDE